MCKLKWYEKFRIRQWGSAGGLAPTHFLVTGSGHQRPVSSHFRHPSARPADQKMLFVECWIQHKRYTLASTGEITDPCGVRSSPCRPSWPPFHRSQRSKPLGEQPQQPSVPDPMARESQRGASPGPTCRKTCMDDHASTIAIDPVRALDSRPYALRLVKRHRAPP